MKRIIYTILGLLIAVSSGAQEDVHFSQFFSSPLMYNPATAGVIDGDLRVFGNYRSQWASITTSPYKSTAFSIDAPIITEGDEGNFFGIGVHFFNDVAGEGTFKSTAYNVNLSYTLQMTRSQYMSFGIKGGFLQRSLDFGKFNYSNQWVIDEFDTSRPAGETFVTDQVAAIDLGAGLYYYNRLNKFHRFFAGLAVDHVNQPNVSFIGAEENYLMRYTGHFGAELTQRNTNLTIMPNFIFVYQGANQYLNVGSDFKFVLNGGSKMTGYYKEVSFSAGAYYRWNDAAYVTGRFNYDEYSFGFSYDITMSDLSKTVGSTGALEFMISYQPFLTDRTRKNKMF